MSTTNSARHGCVTVYGAVYAMAVVFALLSGDGAGGGMAFAIPMILGFPWTLFLGVLLLVPQLPTPMVVILLLVAPPVINMLLILRTRGVLRATEKPSVGTKLLPPDLSGGSPRHAEEDR
jgi:hypothetical protein